MPQLLVGHDGPAYPAPGTWSLQLDIWTSCGHKPPEIGGDRSPAAAAYVPGVPRR